MLSLGTVVTTPTGASGEIIDAFTNWRDRGACVEVWMAEIRTSVIWRAEDVTVAEEESGE